MLKNEIIRILGLDPLLKGLYGQAIMNCQRQHKTLNFIIDHMNYELVETWRSFQFSSDPVIINVFNKINIIPLTLPDEYTNTRVCLAAAQPPRGESGVNLSDS